MSRAVSREIGPSMAATGSMPLSAATAVRPRVVAGEARLRRPRSQRRRSHRSPRYCALGVFNTALAYFVYFRLIASAGATFAALNNYIVPLFGLIAGALALGEPVGPSSWLGLACVLGGVVLTGTAANASRVIAER